MTRITWETVNEEINREFQRHGVLGIVRYLARNTTVIRWLYAIDVGITSLGQENDHQAATHDTMFFLGNVRSLLETVNRNDPENRAAIEMIDRVAKRLIEKEVK